jgi:hypothetical protein
VLRRFTEQLKDAIDPNGIISPGRAGVWLRRFRSMRGGMRSEAARLWRSRRS